MHLTDDKGLAVFLAYRNLSCPILVFSVIPSVMEIVLHRVCQHILNALFGKLLKDRFDCNSRRKSVIDIVFADRSFNGFFASHIRITGGAVHIKLTGFIGVVCHLTVHRDIVIRGFFLLDRIRCLLSLLLRLLNKQHLELGVDALNHLSRSAADCLKRAFQLFGVLIG